ncbi:MAG: 50S ribosomal protein L11 methyltransferase [Spirochaetes bacterium]|nr:50S ribosomal protein L11 methyltransferase [Spirochaetota bacterium]
MPPIEPVIINIVDDPDDLDIEAHAAVPSPFLSGITGAGPWHGTFMNMFMQEGDDAEPIEYVSCAGPASGVGTGPVMITIESHHTFGDGRHPTTRLCVRFLLEHLAGIDTARRDSMALIDAGTGTGVLSIIAAELGIGAIDAVDLYRHAVQCAARNIAVNGCARIRLHESDIASFETGRRYDIVAANLVTDVIIANIGKLIGLTAPGGVIIASGISAASDERARACFSERGLRIAESAVMDGWCGYLLAVE